MLSVSSTSPRCSVLFWDLGWATFLWSTSTSICNSINVSRSMGRGADRFGTVVLLVLMMGGFVSLDRVRDDTGLTLDLVRFETASGSEWITFLDFRAGGLGLNCSNSSSDVFFVRPCATNVNEGSGGLNVIVPGGVM